MKLLARGIDEKGLHVVAVRRGDVITTKRFGTLAEADLFAETFDMSMPNSKPAKGKLSTFNCPLEEMA